MRSGGFSPRSHLDSNEMLIWRGCASGSSPFCEALRGWAILLLLDDVGIVSGASPKSPFQEQSVQLSQGAYRNARRTDLHGRADAGVGHPRRQYRDNAWCNLDMEYTTIPTLLAVMQSQTTSVTRMPTVMDLNLLPDMGRMSL